MISSFGISASICFNGAAPVRARKCNVLHEERCGCAVLQRGRACEGAEMGMLKAGITTPTLLQRGRACEGAEIR